MSVGSFLFGGNPQRRNNQAALEETQFSNVNGAAGEVSGSNDDAFANRPVFSQKPLDLTNKDFEHTAKYGKWQRPVSRVDADPFQFSSLVYPRDITNNDENGHYMLFYVNVQNKTKYGYDGYDAKGKQIRIGDKVVELGRGKTTLKSGADPSYTQGINSIAAGGKGNIDTSDGVDLRRGRKAKQGMASYNPTTSRITDSVAIYLPAQVVNNTSAVYDGAALGALGLAAAGGGKFMNAMRRGDYMEAASLVGGSGSQIIKAGLQKAISEGVDLFFETQSASDLFDKTFGNATNPYMEVFFGGMNLRTFQYNFKFQPRNEDERDDVQKIIKLFRFHMAPELQGENMRYLTLPSTFDIHYMFQHNEKANMAKENDFYHKIATCVLKSVDVDYSSDGVKSFADGSPTLITMNLSFLETELMTKEMIDEGF